MDKPVELKVEVSSVIFHSPESGYTIARAKSGDEAGYLTIVGNMGKVTPGEMLTVTGQWKEHPKYGRQLEVAHHEQSLPATENGVIRFLASNIKGVGKKTAEKLVKRFGVDILDILDNDPDELLSMRGISAKKLESIKDSWAGQRAAKNLIVFLHSHEIAPTYAGRIFNLYGAQAIKRIRDNPYTLAYEIRGIGFKKADDMALKLGFEKDSSERLQAAIVFTLVTQSERGGHVYLPRTDLISATSEMLGGMDQEKLESALYSLEEAKRVVQEPLEDSASVAVYLGHHYHWEVETTKRLHGLLSHPTPVSREKVAKTLPEVEDKVRINLSDEQREAVFQSCANKVFIITGGPGTGKTTITRAIVQTMKALGLKVRLAAPTGRAAKRLGEATRQMAFTIHRLLQYSPESGFQQSEDNKLKTDVLVVDEASMLDSQLFLAVLKALPHTSRLVLVGDVNQLPSVGPGNVLADLLDSQTVPHARLSRIFRQARQSTIVVNAHRINEGKTPVESKFEPPKADFFWIRQDDPARIQSMILEMVSERIPVRYGLDPMRDIQVLTPMHKGDLGTQALNRLLQDRLNPATGTQIERGRNFFRPGDRVLALRNNYEKEVFNGDLGRVVEVDPAEGEVAAEFDCGMVHFEASELDELAPAYAISVHKSQGSEYPAVIIPLVTQHFILLQRNLVYTALTRARKLAVFVGSPKAVGIALKNANTGKRHTRLCQRLRDVFSQGNLLDA